MEDLESFFHFTTDGACGVSSGQRIVLWNRAAEELLGYTARDVLGRCCFDVLRGVGEDGCPVCRRGCTALSAACGMRTTPTRNLHVRTRHGEILWLSVSTVALPRRWRPDAVLVHLFRDISSYKTCHDAVEQMLVRLGTPPAALQIDRVSGERRAEPSPTLTARELEVLSLLASGTSTRDLADALCLSVSTVRNHVHNILRKLEVHSRMEAVMVALRRGLL